MAMIGKMRARITFKAPTITPVGAGGQATTYTDVLTDWAKARQLRSGVGVEAFQTALAGHYQFTLRWREGFVPAYDMLVEYQGETHTITSIEDFGERERYWIITAVKKP